MGSKGAPPLTEQQKRFVEEYLIDFNAGAAVIRAGYSKNGAYTSGSRLLRLVQVSREVTRRRKAQGERLGVKSDRITQELMRVAFSDIRQVATWDGEKLEHIPSDELDDDAAAAIKSVKNKKKTTIDGDGNPEMTIEQEIVFHDKMRALEMLAKRIGYFKDDDVGKALIGLLTPEQAKKILDDDYAAQPDEKVEIKDL